MKHRIAGAHARCVAVCADHGGFTLIKEGHLCAGPNTSSRAFWLPLGPLFPGKKEIIGSLNINNQHYRLKRRVSCKHHCLVQSLSQLKTSMLNASSRLNSRLPCIKQTQLNF
eukprot:scaffold203597_cov15-Tisochrysis_lutea.AAC.1